MSGKNSVCRNHRLSSKIAVLSLSLIFAAVFFGALPSISAAEKSDQSSSKENVSSAVNLSEFKAERFSEAVKITWQTSLESKIVGFRVWRETAGFSELVNEEIVPGSVLKTRDGVLPSGDEYRIFDFGAAENSVYRLEAIYLSGKSLWFGHFDARAEIETDEIAREIAGYRNARSVDAQTESVELATAQTEQRSLSAVAASDEFTNSSSAVKFQVKKNGWHYIGAATVAAAGFSGSSTNWKLYADGIEQAMIVNADNSIEFYGRAADTPHTDSRVYWLYNSPSGGKRIPQIKQGFSKRARYVSSRTVVEKRDRTMRVAGALNGERENWFGAVVNSTGTNQVLNLKEVAFESGQTATIDVDLQGATTALHQVAVSLNGVEIGRIDYNYLGRREWSQSVSLTRLIEGNNVLTLRSVGASPDLSIIESVRINYPRRMKVINNSGEFQVSANEVALIKGFSGGDIQIYDITDPASISQISTANRIEADGTRSVTYTAPATSARILLVKTRDAAVTAIDSLVQNTPSLLKSPSNGADFVIVAPRAYFDSLAVLKAARETERIAVQLVDIADIYDEFSNGNKSPQALKNFFRYAKENWTLKPNYAMLVGDASFDPRNYSGFGGDAADIVPTMFVDTWNIEAVSDEVLVDFNGDGIGEMSIGRLPARNKTELDAMVRKIMAFAPLSAAEASRRGVAFVSDMPIQYDFAGASRRISSGVSAAVAPKYLDRELMDHASMRGALLNTVNSGAAVVNYFGHGNLNNWNGNVLTVGDEAGMTNAQMPSLMVMVACLNGSFTDIISEGLSEAMMRSPNGGAFAAWSASAMNGARTQEYLAKEFYGKVFSGVRLGDAARESKALFTDTDIRQTYVYFGDPTQRLIVQ